MIKHSLIALALTAGMTTGAIAQDNIDVSAGGDVRVANVNIADLDLASSTGRAALHARLRQAVNQVCNFSASRFDVDTICAIDAQRDASQQASAAIHATASGRVAQTSVVLRGVN